MSGKLDPKLDQLLCYLYHITLLVCLAETIFLMRKSQ